MKKLFVLLTLLCGLRHECNSETQFYRGAVESSNTEPTLSTHSKIKSSLEEDYNSRVPLRDAVEQIPPNTHPLKLQKFSDGGFEFEYYGAASYFNRRNTSITNTIPDAGSDGNEIGTKAASSKKLVCFVTSWSFYRRGEGKFVPEYLPSNLCTHIIYSYASLAPDTLLMKVFDSWADIENGLYSRITKTEGSKKLLAIGGWTDSAGDKYSKLVESPSARTAFVSQAVSFLKMHGFDGLHMDWQYPICWQSDCRKGPKQDKENYAKLIEELSRALKQAGLELGVSVPGYVEVINVAYDLRKISEAADFITAMTYDYHGGWESALSHPTPLVSREGDTLPKYTITILDLQLHSDPFTGYGLTLECPLGTSDPKLDCLQTGQRRENAIKALITSGVQPDKLIMGIAYYGQSFRLKETSSAPGSPSSGPGEPGEFTKQPGMMAYHEICYRVNSLRWKTGKQNQAGPYAYSGDQWVGYDDPDSIKEKINWAMSNGLGGAAAWTVDLDDFTNRCCRESWPLLKATARALRLITSPPGAPSCEKVPEPVTPLPPTTTVQDDGYMKPTTSTTTTWPTWTQATSQTWWPQPSSTTTTTSTSTTQRASSQTWWPQPSSTTTTTKQPTTTTKQTTTTTKQPTTTSTTTTSRPSTASAASTTASYKPPQSTSCTTGAFLPVKGDCNAYMVCAGGSWHVQRCAPSLHWNNKVLRCDWPKDVDCGTATSVHRPPSATVKPKPTSAPTKKPTSSINKPLYPDNFKCTSGQYYAHESCGRFYICVNNAMVAQNCAPGLAWNDRVSRCDFISETSCKIHQHDEMPMTMAATEKITTADDLIVSTFGEKMTTVSEKVTTVSEKMTKSPVTEKASSSLENEAVVSEENEDGNVVVASDYADECENGEFYPYPSDCNRYLSCVWGKLEEFSCAAGLHWNQAKRNCDWPRHANCKKGTQSPTDHKTTKKPYKPKPTTKAPATQTPSYVDSVWTPPTTTTTPLPYVLDPALMESGKKLVCYFTNWAWYRPGTGKFLPEHINPDLCTHIVYGFAVLSFDSLTIRAHDSWADFDNHFYARVIAYKQYGIKVSLALGGWNDSAGDKYSKLVNNPSARARFVETTVALLEKYGFDGLDLDWEYPKCWQVDCSKGPDSDKQGFSALVEELSAAFKPRGLLLSSAVSPNKKVIDAGYDVPILSRCMDWIAVMTYDYHGQWDKKTGHVAPLYYHPEDDVEFFNANFTMNYWIEKGASPSKLVMGFPLYGQSFTLGTQWDTPPELLAKKNETGLNVPARSGGEAGQFTRAKGFLAYYEICERIQKRSWKVVNDPLGRMGPYAYKGEQWVSYDDKAIIKRKVHFAKDLKLAGAMIWALDLDDFKNTCSEGAYPLLTTIKNELIKSSKEDLVLGNTDIIESTNDISTEMPPVAHTTVEVHTSSESESSEPDSSNSITSDTGGKKLVCYFTNWAWYRPEPGKYTPDDVDPTLCTHIVYAFAVLHPEKLTIMPHDTWADIDNNFFERIVALKAKGTRVVLGLGGWNDSAGDKYSRLVNNPTARSRFIHHALGFLEKYGFEGLDLDWEYPKCWQVECEKGPASDKSAFASLVKELRKAFAPKGYLLSAAVSPSKRVIDQGYDVPALSENLDWVSLMGYDYHGQWDKKTGHVAPLYPRPDDFEQTFNVNFSIHYYLEKGLAPSKLVVGVPLYGQSFRLAQSSVHGLNAPAPGPGQAGESTRAAGFLSFYEICDRIVKREWNVVEDPSGKIGPYAYKGDQWVSFDNAKMIGTKGEIIKDLGLGGGMVWALDLDDWKGTSCGCGKAPLISALRRGMALSYDIDAHESCPQIQHHNLEETAHEKPSEPHYKPEKYPEPTTAHPTSEISTTAEVASGVSSGKSCDGDFAPHELCNYYYVCNNGRLVQRPCPPGLHWNQERTSCDWPRDAKCHRNHNLVRIVHPRT